jgi:cation diffusion facilitator family transporter
MLYGIKRSRRPPDGNHSFGHGKEIYFWGFVVAMMLFMLGGGISIVEGVSRLHRDERVSKIAWNYLVLGIAAVAETWSLFIAVRKFRQTAPENMHWWRAVRASKDPSVFLVLAEDSAALAGILVAAIGIFLEQQLHSPVPDAIAAIIIGGILCTVSLLMARETKALLVGETADRDTIEGIKHLATRHPLVLNAAPPLTMHLAPDDILVNMAIEFDHEASGDSILTSVEEIEAEIRREFPDVHRIFIEAASLRRSATLPSPANPPGA